MTAILYVGDLNPYTRSEQRFRALASLGLDVTGLSFTRVTSGAGESEPTFAERLWSRAGRPRDPTGVNRAIVSACADRRFDVLWIDKAPCVRDATLRRVARTKRTALLFHSDDDMFARHNQTDYFRRALPLYDLVASPKSFNCDLAELPALGARRVLYVHQAYDPEFHRPVEVDAAARARVGSAVGFVGTFEEDRARRMLVLATHGVRVRVFGNGWGGWRGRHENLIIEDRPVYGDEYIRCLCATDINLGFLRKCNRDQHTSRSLDIPACGAFYLGERTEEQRALFAEGSEADYFDTDDEMIAKVRHYLDRPEERRAIGAAGRWRCLMSSYDHATAMRRVLDHLQAATRTEVMEAAR